MQEPGHQSDTALIVLARYPAWGKVKTRLADEMGHDFALSFYRSCSANIFEEAARLIPELDVYCFAIGANEDAMQEWCAQPFLFAQQHGGDLGERMLNAFNSLFEKGYNRALLCGTDIPDFTADAVRQAAEALKTHDAVVGPAADGGYFMIGLREPMPFLFDSFTFGNADVFSNTMMKLNQMAKTAAVLPELTDIDTKEDLEQWAEKNEGRELPHHLKELREEFKRARLHSGE